MIFIPGNVREGLVDPNGATNLQLCIGPILFISNYTLVYLFILYLFNHARILFIILYFCYFIIIY